MIFCPICKSETRLIWEEKKYRVYRCKNCTVAFLYPFPENTEDIYNENYFQNWYISHYEERKKYIEKLFISIEKHIEEKGKLLDVGCGVGILLDVAKERGWEVYGQDISSFAVNYCRAKGATVFDKPLTELYLFENSFDIITMLDVIAHLQNPDEYLKICSLLLKKDGVLIVKTPNRPEIIFQLVKILSYFVNCKGLLHIPSQIYHFTPHSCLKILQKNGFEIISTKMVKETKLRIYSLKNLATYCLTELLNFFKIKESFIICARKR